MKNFFLTQLSLKNSSNNIKSIFSQNKFLICYYTKKPKFCMIINLRKRTKLIFDKYNFTFTRYGYSLLPKNGN